MNQEAGYRRVACCFFFPRLTATSSYSLERGVASRECFHVLCFVRAPVAQKKDFISATEMMTRLFFSTTRSIIVVSHFGMEPFLPSPFLPWMMAMSICSSSVMVQALRKRSCFLSVLLSLKSATNFHVLSLASREKAVAPSSKLFQSKFGDALERVTQTLPPVPPNAHRIIACRHGESEFNNANVFTGW
jgi:hypothetical protein